MVLALLYHHLLVEAEYDPDQTGVRELSLRMWVGGVFEMEGTTALSGFVWI